MDDGQKLGLLPALFLLFIALVVGTWISQLPYSTASDPISWYLRLTLSSPTAFVIGSLPFVLFGWLIVKRIPQKILIALQDKDEEA